jgi:hypothetical protein
MINRRLRVLSGAACAIAIFIAPGSRLAVAARSPQAAILHQEARWLEAILNGDRNTIASILSTNYKHVDSKGALFDRSQELASVTKEQLTMKWSEQTFDFAGNVAVVHGVNTITRAHKVSRERYTDVYVNQSGTWLALSAQETAIAP